MLPESRSVLETALGHRSIRKFTDRPIKPELLQTLLHAGQMASSSNFLQNVSIIRVSDRKQRARIRSVCAGAYAGLGHHYVENCAEFLVFCADMSRHHQLVPDAQTDWAEVLLIGTVDVGIFAQNVLLAAESVGLGGVFIGSLRNKLPETAEILQTPEHVIPLVGMCLGYPDQQPAVRPRLPLACILSENCYQAAAEQDLYAYNEQIRAYYRERNGTDSDWRTQIAAGLDKEVRPQVLPFLQQQGFAKR